MYQSHCPDPRNIGFSKKKKIGNVKYVTRSVRFGQVKVTQCPEVIRGRIKSSKVVSYLKGRNYRVTQLRSEANTFSTRFTSYNDNIPQNCEKENPPFSRLRYAQKVCTPATRSDSGWFPKQTLDFFNEPPVRRKRFRKRCSIVLAMLLAVLFSFFFLAIPVTVRYFYVPLARTQTPGGNSRVVKSTRRENFSFSFRKTGQQKFLITWTDCLLVVLIYRSVKLEATQNNVYYTSLIIHFMASRYGENKKLFVHSWECTGT